MLTLLVIAATAYWYFLGATAVVSRLVPAVMGWRTTVVIGSSMEPALSPGDLIALTRYQAGEGAVGAIITFHDAASDGGLTTHRVVAIGDDGSLMTRGDANSTPDSTQVPESAVVGIARLVSPGGGLPVYWWTTGRSAHLALWLGLSMCALLPLVGADLRVGRRRTKSGLALVVAVLIVGVSLGSNAASAAVYSSSTTNPGNVFEAPSGVPWYEVGTGSCGSTATQLTVTNSVPAGDGVVVQIAIAATTGPGAGAFAATDSSGNTWQLDATSTDANRSSVAVLSSSLTTGLMPGDWIQVTHRAAQATAVRADAFSTLAVSNRVVTSAGASGNATTATVSVTSNTSDTFAIGVLATSNSAAIMPDTNWSTLSVGDVTCTTTMGRVMAWRPVPSPQGVTFAVGFGATERWSNVVVIYRTTWTP